MKKAALCLSLFLSFFQIARTQSVSFEIQAGLSSSIRKILPIPGRVCIATVQGDLVLWDPSRNRIDSRLNLEEEIYDLALLPDQKRIAVSTPSKVIFYDAESGILDEIDFYSCENPTALFSGESTLFVATRHFFLELDIKGSEPRPLRRIPKRDDPTYSFRTRGDRILEASNLGFHIYPLTAEEAEPDENEIPSLDTSSLDSGEEPVEQAVSLLASFDQFNTGWYAHCWDEANDRLYFPSEANLLVIDFSKATLKAELIFTGKEREDYITGLARVEGHLFMGNRFGFLYRFHSSGAKGPGQPIRTATRSVTHLAGLSGLLTVGDFYGNISLCDPADLKTILSLIDESTPAINGVYLDGRKRMVTTHKDPSGAYLTVWDIRTASLVKKQRFLTQQLIGVQFSGDSIRTLHADGASYRIGPLMDTFLVNPPLVAYEPAFGMSLPEKDPMLRIQASRMELREALLSPGTYKWKDKDSGADVIYTVPPGSPGCGSMPPYEQVQKIFRETGIIDYLGNWDLMDQDIFFMKACRSTEEAFLQLLEKNKIPADVGLRFYKRLRSPSLPKLSVIGQGRDTVFSVTKKDLQYLAFHPELGQWILFYPDSVLIIDVKTKERRELMISALPVFFHYALTDSLLAIASVQKSTLYDLKRPGNRTAWLGFGTDQYLVHNRDGYYRLKGRSNKLAGFEENEMKDLAYFDLKYNRPDIVVAELIGEKSAEALAFRAAVEKRKVRTGGKQPVWMDSRVAYEWPLYVKSGSIPIPNSKIPNSKSQLSIWVNGTLEKGHLKEILLSPGLNKVDLRESSRRGDTVYYSDTRFVYSPLSAASQHLYFGAGINTYSDSRLDLRYAVKDINDISSRLLQSIPGLEVKTLFNEKASQAGFAEWRKRLEQTTVNDIVFMSLSGHGYLDEDSSFHFASAGSTMDQYHSAISYDSLLSLLDAAPARRKLLFIDACHSGLTDTESERAKLPPGVTAKTLRKKQDGASSTKAFRMMQEEFLDLTKHNGTIVIAAAGGAEFALETADHRNGLFTYVLIKGLFEGFADKDNDKQISTTELQYYLAKEVERLSLGGQKPSTNQDNQGLEWLILQ